MLRPLIAWNEYPSKNTEIFCEFKVRLHRCWWRMLEMKCVGDNFEILVTDLRCYWQFYWEYHQNYEKNSVTNIMVLSSISKNCHHHKITNIILSSTSLSPKIKMALFLPFLRYHHRSNQAAIRQSHFFIVWFSICHKKSTGLVQV